MRTREFRGKTYRVSDAHPYADLFPWMPDDELFELAESIRLTGQRQPIPRLADGRLADGRNRELACRIAGVEPVYRDLQPSATRDEEGLVAAIVNANLRRRHLTPSQRAMIAAEIARLTKPPASREADAEEGDEKPVTQREAAAELGVSRASVQRAAEVIQKAPELADLVSDGRLDVKTAAAASSLPEGFRKKILGAPDPKASTRKFLKFKPGSNADPDHPFAKILALMSNLRREITLAINGEGPHAEKLKAYLTYLKLVHHRDLIVDGRKFGCFFKGFGLRGVVKLAGKAGKVKDFDEVKKALGEEDDG
jgi:predicted DNA-binding protein (UPF0251 family)